MALVGLADVLHFGEGRSHEAAQTVDFAVSLLVDSPPSAAKAAALANRARFHAIADEMEEASRLAEEALELAVALGLEELQAHALNTRGIARTVSGDLRGVEDLEQSMSTAPSHSFERMRAMNNLAAIHIGLGELDRGFTLVEQSLQEARRLGHAVGIGWAETQLLDRLYWQGAWDELLERSEVLLTLLASDALNTTDAHILRARVHLGRDALAKPWTALPQPWSSPRGRATRRCDSRQWQHERASSSSPATNPAPPPWWMGFSRHGARTRSLLRALGSSSSRPSWTRSGAGTSFASPHSMCGCGRIGSRGLRRSSTETQRVLPTSTTASARTQTLPLRVYKPQIG